MRETLTTQPAAAKALGMVRAPVPTIRLNMYTKPIYMNIKQTHVYSRFKRLQKHRKCITRGTQVLSHIGAPLHIICLCFLFCFLTKRMHHIMQFNKLMFEITRLKGTAFLPLECTSHILINIVHCKLVMSLTNKIYC